MCQRCIHWHEVSDTGVTGATRMEPVNTGINRLSMMSACVGEMVAWMQATEANSRILEIAQMCGTGCGGIRKGLGR